MSSHTRSCTRRHDIFTMSSNSELFNGLDCEVTVAAQLMLEVVESLLEGRRLPSLLEAGGGGCGGGGAGSLSM